MKKILFIVPYYGAFPSYFREWAFTAGFLKEQAIGFLLVTDNSIEFKLPDNIQVLKLSFEELKKRIQEKFDFKIKLVKPYKLCDFRPAFGYIFEEELRGYDFWGNCDIDQVWGDVRSFVTDDILNRFDRVYHLGHLTLYRNTPVMNRLFRQPGAIYDYKRVFSDSMHYSYDEHSGMMRIAAQNGVSNYIKTDQADLSPRYTRMIVSRRKNYDHQILYWEKGHVFRSFIDKDGTVGRDEFIYFHFQKKNPQSLRCWEQGALPERIIYHADGFTEDRAVPVTAEYICKNSDFISHHYDRKENRKYICLKIKTFFHSSIRKKTLWIKQKNVSKIELRKVLNK